MFVTRVINYMKKNVEHCAAIKFCCKAGFTARPCRVLRYFNQWRSLLAACEESIEDAELVIPIIQNFLIDFNRSSIILKN